MPNNRVRSVTQEGYNETAVFRCVTGATSGHPDQIFVHPYSGYESLYEECTPDQPGPRSTWKDWQHYKVFTGDPSSTKEIVVTTEQWGYNPDYYVGTFRDPYAGYTSYSSSGTSQRYGEPGKLNSGLPELYVAQSDGGFVPPPDGLDGLIQRALSTMLPNIKADLSLVNSLVELKDFRSLPLLVRRLGKALTTVNSFRSSKTLAKMSPDVYLQWSFNIKPLLSDICGIHAALTRFERRINDLITREGRVQRRHYVYRWAEFTDGYEEAPSYTDGWFDESYRLAPLQLFSADRTVRYAPTTFHAEIEYNFNYTRYQAEHARLLSLLDALGVNLNPAIIWNAIPWSFVVDWVFGVSRWLDQFKVENMKPQINIREFLWSVRRSRDILVTVGIRPTVGVPGPSVGQRTRLPVVHEASYRRQSDLPSASSIQSSGLSLREFSLGAALVLARRRTRHR